MEQQLLYKDIVGSSQVQVSLSTSGQAQSLPLARGIYDIWTPTQDASISIQTAPVSTAPITSSNGYLIKAGLAPQSFKVPANGVIVCGSTISSGVLAFERTAGY